MSGLPSTVSKAIANRSAAAMALLIIFGCSEPQPKKKSATKNPTGAELQQNASTAPGEATAVAAAGAANSGQVAQAQQLKSSIKTRYSDLENNRNRQGLLIAELTNTTTSGCFANMKMEKLEILIKGSWLDRKFVGDMKNLPASTGNPATVTFQFGDSIAVVNDEATNGLFQAAGRKVVTELVEYDLSSVEYIRISKGGAAFDGEERCTGGGLFSSRKCKYKVFEERRYELDSIELKINDETFYKRDAIRAQLEDNNLEWSDNNISVNEACLRLMQRQDCPQGQ